MDTEREVSNKPLAVRLVVFAIAMCITSGLLHALQNVIERPDGPVEASAPHPGAKPGDDAADALIADLARPEGRMFVTDELREWIGSDSASGPRTVY